MIKRALFILMVGSFAAVAAGLPGLSQPAASPVSVKSDWGVFERTVKQRPGVLSINLALKGLAPMRDRPHLLLVRVLLKHPTPDGLPSPEETQARGDIEDSLSATFIVTLKAVLVGRLTTGGYQEMYYYAPSDHGFETTARSLMTNFPSYRFELEKRADPSWTRYLHGLYPSVEEMQAIKNNRRIARLVQAGDALTKPRSVQHTFFFPSLEGCRQFEHTVQREGFSVQEAGVPAPGGNPFGLRISRQEKPVPRSINLLVSHLVGLSHRWGGTYEGWDAPVVH